MPYGFGRIFQHKKSGTWFIAFSQDGREIRESVAKLVGKPPSECTKADAGRALKQRLAEKQTGAYQGPEQDKQTVRAMMESYQKHTDAHCKAKKTARIRIRRVVRDLGDLKVRTLNRARIMGWINGLLSEGLRPATANGFLRTLRAAMRLADVHVPKVKVLPENNVRTGFTERATLERVIAHLPPYMTDVVWFGYYTGWRQEEILGLEWTRVDLAEGVIELSGAQTKTGRPRTIPMLGELAMLITLRDLARQGPYVFHRAGLRGGLRITPRRANYYWRKATRAAGCPTLLFHDLRRTALRNFIRAGVTEAVAMTISGHRSRTVFDRYNITSTLDQQAAFRRLEAHQQQQEADTP